MLRVKLVRMFQRSAQPTVSASDLVSALIAKPDFLLSPRGSINHLLEVARQRTAQESSAREKSKALSHRLRLLEAAERVVTTGDGAYALFRITETEQIRSDGRQLKNCLKGLPDVYVSGRREPM